MTEAALATTTIRAPETTEQEIQRSLVILHGILGRGSNWRSFARGLVRARPKWEAVLVDLRAHGESRGYVEGVDSVEQCARDVATVLQTLPAASSASILGHSFGGKVALSATRIVPLAAAFLVDSLPGARPDRRGSETTQAVIDSLSTLPSAFENRDGFLQLMDRAGHAPAIGQWLAQNLERSAQGVRFGLDVTRIEALLHDYFNLDLWDCLAPPHTRADVVIAGRSPVFGDEDREQIRDLAERFGGTGGLTVHTLETAGHWVHIDAPSALLDIVIGALDAR